jgi:hypothetical protein
MNRLFLVSIAALFLATEMMVIAARSAHAQTVCAGKYEQKVDFNRCMRDWVDPQPDNTRAKDIIPAFRPWQQVWQCNDIRIVEFSNQQGLIEYDLSSTIWGGSQFARDLNRDMLFFNGRPCLKVAR